MYLVMPKKCAETCSLRITARFPALVVALSRVVTFGLSSVPRDDGGGDGNIDNKKAFRNKRMTRKLCKKNMQPTVAHMRACLFTVKFNLKLFGENERARRDF